LLKLKEINKIDQIHIKSSGIQCFRLKMIRVLISSRIKMIRVLIFTLIKMNRVLNFTRIKMIRIQIFTRQDSFSQVFSVSHFVNFIFGGISRSVTI